MYGSDNAAIHRIQQVVPENPMEVQMRSIKGLGMLALATSVATAVTVGVSVTAAHAQATAISVDPVGMFDAESGAATITGTVDCGGAEGPSTIEANLSQSVGRVSTVFGSSFADIEPCTAGAQRDWTVTIFPSNGKFRGGKATASARLLDTGAETTEPVSLKGGPSA